MPYERIDIDKACETIKELTGKMKYAASGNEMIRLREQSILLARHIQSMTSLCNIRFTLNTTDEYYLSEKQYYDANLPKLAAEGAKFNKAFLHNEHINEALEKINPNVAKVYELTLKTMDEKIVPDLSEESALVTEYDRLMSETLFRFGREEMPLSMLRKYFDDADREVRRKAMETAGKRLAREASKLDGLFDKLVKVRSRMADKLGFSSYAEMGDCMMGRYSYGRKEIRVFRDEVEKNIVPLVAKLKRKRASQLGISDIKLYDNEVYFRQGNPEPILGAEEMFAAAKDMYHDMGAATAEFIDNMLAADAFDVFPRAGKWGGGYCTSVDDYGQPFILANFNGSSGDVDVLTHEAGHALAFYEMFKGGSDYELNLGTMSVAEIHSMAMEFFAWKYMDKFFGKRARDYKYMHLFSSLTFLPYGTEVDEFQEICYENPDLTPAERNELWKDLDKKYRPYLNANGIPYFERGTRWQYQMHIYENPMYYIDYCLSQSVAHSFLSLSLKNYNDAFARYMKLVSEAGSLPFGELVENAGLPNPLKPGALTSTTSELSDILDKLL